MASASRSRRGSNPPNWGAYSKTCPLCPLFPTKRTFTIRVPMPCGQASSDLLEVAKAFRPRLIADRDRIETGRRIPDEIARDLARAGFFRVFLPEAYGGGCLIPTLALVSFEGFARAA